MKLILITGAAGGVARMIRPLMRADYRLRLSDRRPIPDRIPDEEAAAAELKSGQTRKETEGVFVLRGGRAEFVPIKVGIAGDKYFEVLSGLKENDQVITGPYNSVRGMMDGTAVKVDTPKK